MEVRKQIYFQAYTNPSSVLRHLWRPNLLQLHILATPHPGFIRLFWEKRYHSVFTFTIAPGGLRGILSCLPERKLLPANSCCAIVPCAIGTQHCLDHRQKKGFVRGGERERMFFINLFTFNVLLCFQNQAPWYKSPSWFHQVTAKGAVLSWGCKIPGRVTKITGQHENCFSSTNQF